MLRGERTDKKMLTALSNRGKKIKLKQQKEQLLKVQHTLFFIGS